MNIVGQKQTMKELNRIVEIFRSSECTIRPHFFLTGPSGSGKTVLINAIAKKNDCNFLEINTAQLTKEGTSGNSLSKALSPLINSSRKPTIVFCDEFDKLFISGNSNSQLAHESTNGVQNEFLKVLESDNASVYGDFGKYVNVPVDKCLFVFAGAFNNEPDITIDRLREFGIKTEFIGRVGLAYTTQQLTLEELYTILEEHEMLTKYCELFANADREKVVFIIKAFLRDNYDNNTIGARVITTLIHQYFIKGGKLGLEDVKQITFQKKLSFDGNNTEASNEL